MNPAFYNNNNNNNNNNNLSVFYHAFISTQRRFTNRKGIHTYS